MRRIPASMILLLGLAVVLGGCPAEKPPKIESNLYPQDYKKEIVATLKVGVFDKNDTIRITNAMISDPVLQEIGKEQHYVSCVSYTAHGTEYNIAANATRVAYFYGGHLNQIVPAGKDQCVNADYKPFPELNAVCLGKGCK